MTKRVRGFEKVGKDFKKNKSKFKDEKGKIFLFDKDIKLPTRSDKGSSGYDFYSPIDVDVLPGHDVLIWTDVKAYMQEDEELCVIIRSSMAIKHGIVLANQEGKIDSSYYSNPANDGNIGICLRNTSGRTYTIKEGERIAQGTFRKYLLADDDKPVNEERSGGIGSSGK